jgi:hypothetical protein
MPGFNKIPLEVWFLVGPMAYAHVALGSMVLHAMLFDPELVRALSLVKQGRRYAGEALLESN